MTIQVRCPNAGCGKLLSVQDSFAGKTGRCPNCGNTLAIPFPETGEPPDRGGPPRTHEDAPGGFRRSRHARADDYDDYDEYDDVDYEGRRPSRRRSGYGGFREIQKEGGAPVGTLVCLGIGIGLLVVLGLLPLFPMYSIHVPLNMPTEIGTVGGMIQLTEGKIILIVTEVIALLCMAALILYLTIPETTSEVFLTISGCLAGGWGLAAVCWFVGFIWDIVTVNNSIQQIGRAAGGEGIAPGVGLWIGLVVGLGVVAVFSILLALRRRTPWLYVGEASGLVVGVLLLVLNVQPWSTGVDQKELQANPFLWQQHKLITRYLPLFSTWRQTGRR